MMHRPAGVGLFGVAGVTPADLRHGGFVWFELFQELDPCTVSPSVTRAINDEWLRGEPPLRFETRIVGVDGAIADEWGRLIARREARAASRFTPRMRSLRRRRGFMA